MASKNYTVYGSGGRNKRLKLDDGLRAMQEQTTRMTNALKEQELQNRIQSQAFTSGLESKAKKKQTTEKSCESLKKRDHVKCVKPLSSKTTTQKLNHYRDKLTSTTNYLTYGETCLLLSLKMHKIYLSQLKSI